MDEGAGSGGAPAASELMGAELSELGDMTVEQWLNAQLEKLSEAANEAVDDAVDYLALTHKQQREEIRNMQHIRRVEREKGAAAVAPSGDLDVVATVEAVGEGAPEGTVGQQLRVSPRQGPSSMARIGRSEGAEFQPPRGISLPFDPSVSVWHGKLTCVGATIFYSDLNTRNGTTLNGKWVTPDAPVPLSPGDVLGMGDTKLRIDVVPAAHEGAGAGAGERAAAKGGAGAR